CLTGPSKPISPTRFICLFISSVATPAATSARSLRSRASPRLTIPINSKLYSTVIKTIYPRSQSNDRSTRRKTIRRPRYRRCSRSQSKKRRLFSRERLSGDVRLRPPCYHCPTGGNESRVGTALEDRPTSYDPHSMEVSDRRQSRETI